MKLHANARTCPNSRRLLVTRIEEEGWSLKAAAEAAGISERSASKWLGRWRTEGAAGLLDRSSAPKRVPSRLPADRLGAQDGQPDDALSAGCEAQASSAIVKQPIRPPRRPKMRPG